MGVLPSVTENEALSGLEFTAYVDNIEDRQRFDAAADGSSNRYGALPHLPGMLHLEDDIWSVTPIVEDPKRKKYNNS